MAGTIIDQWFAAASVEENYQTMHVWDGDGNAARVFELNFQGGYINQADVKAFMVNKTTQERTDLTVRFTGTNTVTLSQAVPTTHQVTIYRDTNKSSPLASFADGAIITAINLDRNAKQAVFAVAEMVDRFDSVTATAQDAIATAYTALDKANTAIKTADGAVVTANAASSASAGAVKDAKTAISTANAATDTANSAKATAEGIDAKVNAAVSTANDANATADAANATANGIDAKATEAQTNAAKAKTDAATALSTANGIDAKATQALNDSKTAKTNAATALSTAQGIDAKATEALTKASAADKTATAAKTSVDNFLVAVDSVTASTVTFKGRIITNSGNPGLTLQADMPTQGNYLQFWDTKSGTRKGYVGFGSPLDGSNQGRVYLQNDSMPNGENAGFSNNSGYADTSRTGCGSWDSQRTQEAPFFHSFASASTSEYNPAFKQRFSSSAARWHGTWSIGTLVSSNTPEVRLHIVGSGDTTGGKSWAFLPDGSTTCPGNLYLTGGAGTATYRTDGNINGNTWGGNLSTWLNDNLNALVNYLARGAQVYSKGSGTGSGRAIEAPAGCFMTGINTNVSDGRGMGIYWRALQFRRRNGSLQNIGG